MYRICCLLLTACLAFFAVPAVAADAPVTVLYAGSLIRMMEQGVGPAFEQATGLRYQGEGKGSVALAKLMLSGLRTADVFISADPKVNAQLMGAAHHDLVRWYADVFRNEMVIAYNPKSRFAPQWQQVKADKIPFWQVLGEKGFRLGRTDPALDPKGYRTLFVFDLAGQQNHQPGLRQRLLGDAENPAQVFPEEQLVARLEAGQLDAGMFYRNEVQGILPYVTLPAAVNLGDPREEARYASVQYRRPNGSMVQGHTILYTVTIPENARNRTGAVAFVRYLLSPAGRAVLARYGMPVLTQPMVQGDAHAVPAALRTVLNQSEHP